MSHVPPPPDPTEREKHRAQYHVAWIALGAAVFGALLGVGATAIGGLFTLNATQRQVDAEQVRSDLEFFRPQRLAAYTDLLLDLNAFEEAHDTFDLTSQPGTSPDRGVTPYNDLVAKYEELQRDAITIEFVAQPNVSAEASAIVAAAEKIYGLDGRIQFDALVNDGEYVDQDVETVGSFVNAFAALHDSRDRFQSAARQDIQTQ